MKFSTSEFQYVLLPGQFCHGSYLHLYERAFQFWLNNWTAVYKELNAGISPNPDDFFKQKFVPVILHNDTIVAIHLYSFYDLRADCSLEHSYLHHNFNRDYFETLRGRKIFKVMSMESLFVNAEYRRSKSGIHFMEILISLGQQVFAYNTDCDAVIAPARADNKVAKTAYELGFEGIQQNIRLNNVPVDLIIAKRDKILPPADHQSSSLVEYLWKTRVYADQDAPNSHIKLAA